MPENEPEVYGYQLGPDGQIHPGPATITLSDDSEVLRSSLLSQGIPEQVVNLLLNGKIVFWTTKPTIFGQDVTIDGVFGLDGIKEA